MRIKYTYSNSTCKEFEVMPSTVTCTLTKPLSAIEAGTITFIWSSRWRPVDQALHG